MTSFCEFIVLVYLVASFESLDAVSRDFWAESSVIGTELATAMVKMLGQAMLLMERTWNSLSEEDLKQLVKCVEGARLLRFKVDCLEPVATKAERLLKYYAAKRHHDDLKAKIQEIQREVEAT